MVSASWFQKRESNLIFCIGRVFMFLSFFGFCFGQPFSFRLNNCWSMDLQYSFFLFAQFLASLSGGTAPFQPSSGAFQDAIKKQHQRKTCRQNQRNQEENNQDNGCTTDIEIA